MEKIYWQVIGPDLAKLLPILFQLFKNLEMIRFLEVPLTQNLLFFAQLGINFINIRELVIQV
jgi:hypothetical protein